MNKFASFLLVLTLFTTQYIFAQKGWIDVTDAYVINPSFDNDDVSTGWSGTGYGQYGPKENAEFYSKTFNTYQQISGLTPGKYRLSLKAFYRYGSADNDYNNYISEYASEQQYAQLYATSSVDDEYSPIAFISSGMSDTNYGGGTSTINGSYYVPNNMEAAYYWFLAGYYDNSVEVTVGDDGELTIGIRKDQTNNGDWVCLDDWKLEYYGEVKYATSVSFSSSMYTINLGDELQLSATVLPTDATYSKLSWESSDPEVVTVGTSGLIYGVKKGTATITATTTDGTNLSTSCTISVESNDANAQSMIINEIMVGNTDMYIDPSWNYGSWVELYNPTDKSANVGHYWVSDDSTNLKKAMLPLKVGSIPAKGYLNLWFEHADTKKDISEGYVNTQVDMDLSPDGGTIYISDTAGNLIAKQIYPASLMRISYARKTDGGSEWSYTGNPTPEASNTSSTFAVEQISAPDVDTNGQLFDGSLNVKVTIPTGATLMYTTDGTTPTLTNGTVSTTGLFDVTETTVYRFRLFKSGFLPSNVTTRSYIYKDQDYYLPVVSVVTNPDNLYDDEIGCYVSGTNGKTANMDGTKRNFNMEWDRPVNFEFMKDAEDVFNQETNFSISGGWSRKYEPRSFKIKAQKSMGGKDLAYPFFDVKPYNRNKTLLFRNGGNDGYNKSRIKDAALQEIVRRSGFRINTQAYQPVHVFINGTYLAMLNMREPSNKHYGYANYCIDTDEIDAFEMSVDSGYVQKDGTKDSFNQWYTLAQSAGDALVYQQIQDIVDVEDYVDYMAFKFFLNDWDWPHNNLKAFKGREDGQKFHFIIFDLDNCSGNTSSNNIFSSFANKQTHTFYSRPEYNWTSLTKEVEMVTIFLNMLQNEDFKKKFIDTYCIVGGCVFGNDEENAAIVDEMVNNAYTALGWEGNSGNLVNDANGVKNNFSGSYKQNMINMMKNYGKFDLGSTETQAIQLSSNVDNAKIQIDGIDVPKGKFNGYLFAPVTLKAEAPAGYTFLGWQDSGESYTSTDYIFNQSENWNYYDQGSLDGTGWNQNDYNYSSWSNATAPFGYGGNGKYMSGATTQLNWGTDTNDRIRTYYFQKTFTLNDAPQTDDVYNLNYTVDDAMIAYVNGQEVGTYHITSGADYSTLSQDLDASWYEGDNPHSGTMTIDNSLLKQGENTLTIEVHQCTSHSSDAWWDAEMTVSRTTSSESDSYLSTDPELEMPTSGSHNLVAVYKKIDDAELAKEHVTPIKINEVSASNDKYVNDYYKTNDWIELYNTTNADIDVAGMYVTDNPKKLQKYQIPSGEINTVIPAYGHLVLWCDKLEPITQLHTSFKLDGDGGTIILTDENATWSDTFEYCAHTGLQTVGLYPDGGTSTYVMNVPTIAATNKVGDLDSAYIQPHLDENVEVEYAMGDVNTDNYVNVVDYTGLVSMIMETDEGQFSLKYADFNTNGFADVADLTSLVNVIMGGKSSSVKDRNLIAQLSTNNYKLNANSFMIAPGDEYTFALSINAYANELTNAQLDLKLPIGLTFVKAEVGTLATTKHRLTSSEVKGGARRLMLYSSSNSMLDGENGNLLYVTVKADENIQNGTIDFSNIYVSRQDETLVSVNDFKIDVTAGDATGISEVESEKLNVENYKYLENGNVMIKSQSKGTYTVDGKKMYNNK